MSTAPTPPAPNPPYLVRTQRLVLRCLEPADAALRMDAVEAGHEHLAMIFPALKAGGPGMSFEDHVARVRKGRGNFDTDGDRAYGVFAPDTGRMEGETFLLKRAGLGALEVGYWLRKDAVGQGLATEMASATVQLAFRYDPISRLDLVCHPENERSVAMAKRLGFTFEGRLRDRQLAPHHERGDMLMFSLLASEYPQTRSAQLELEAFDFLGRPLP
jgi:RimJ/RimL family protein N-acetyltransferase